MSTDTHYIRIALITGIFAALFVCILFFYTRMYPDVVHGSRIPGETVAVRENRQEKPPMPEYLYVSAPLTAKAALVADATNGRVLYAEGADDAEPLASVTKVMTGLVALTALQPDDRVVIPAALLDDGADGLREGEVWTVKNLVDFMLITSSNRAARALHTAVNRHALQSGIPAAPEGDYFIEYMNETAARLGMSTTIYKNDSGLDIADTYATNIGSARDVARLFTHILATMPDMFEATEDSKTKIASLTSSHTAVSTNKALAEIPGLIGGKTGFTDAAGGNLAIVFDVEPGHPIVVVVLGSGKDERFSDILTLVRATRTAYGVSSSKRVPLPI